MPGERECDERNTLRLKTERFSLGVILQITVLHVDFCFSYPPRRFHGPGSNRSKIAEKNGQDSREESPLGRRFERI